MTPAAHTDTREAMYIYWCPICEKQTDRGWHIAKRGPALFPQLDEEHTCDRIEVVSAARLAVLEAEHTGDGEHCQMCGRAYEYVYTAPNEVWQGATGQEEGLRCLPCLDALAREAGFWLRWVAFPLDAPFDQSAALSGGRPATPDVARANSQVRVEACTCPGGTRWTDHEPSCPRGRPATPQADSGTAYGLGFPGERTDADGAL